MYTIIFLYYLPNILAANFNVLHYSLEMFFFFRNLKRFRWYP